MFDSTYPWEAETFQQLGIIFDQEVFNWKVQKSFPGGSTKIWVKQWLFRFIVSFLLRI